MTKSTKIILYIPRQRQRLQKKGIVLTAPEETGDQEAGSNVIKFALANQAELAGGSIKKEAGSKN